MSKSQLSTYMAKRVTRRNAIKAGGIAAVGLAFSRPLIETIAPKPAYATFGNYANVPTTTSICLSCIDFEADELGSALAAGTTVAEQWAWFGIHAAALRKGALLPSPAPANTPGPGVPFHSNPLMIFDSSNPTGGDYDLGTPNSTFGGPGIGAGGASNNAALGNVLIINERLSAPADDDAGGGVIAFSFDIPVKVHTVDMLDIDDGNGTGCRVRTFDSQAYGTGIMTRDIVAADLGNNSFQTVVVNENHVRRLEVHLKSSGAVPRICVTDTDGAPLCITVPAGSTFQ